MTHFWKVNTLKEKDLLIESYALLTVLHLLQTIRSWKWYTYLKLYCTVYTIESDTLTILKVIHYWKWYADWKLFTNKSDTLIEGDTLIESDLLIESDMLIESYSLIKVIHLLKVILYTIESDTLTLTVLKVIHGLKVIH